MVLTSEPLDVHVILMAGGRGERFWPLPLWDFYFDALKSDVADMKNVIDSDGTYA